MSEWQPILTAPKDGTTVIIFDQDEVGVGYYDDGLDVDGAPYDPPQWYWFNQTEVGPAEPSHWMPMPDAPTN